LISTYIIRCVCCRTRRFNCIRTYPGSTCCSVVARARLTFPQVSNDKHPSRMADTNRMLAYEFRYRCSDKLPESIISPNRYSKRSRNRSTTLLHRRHQRKQAFGVNLDFIFLRQRRRESLFRCRTKIAYRITIFVSISIEREEKK
jgi:hypothetical protein